MIKIDIDKLLDLLLPFKGQIHELRILPDKLILMKTDATTKVIAIKKLQKEKEKKNTRETSKNLYFNKNPNSKKKFFTYNSGVV